MFDVSEATVEVTQKGLENGTLFECEQCGQVHDSENCTVVEGEKLCPECAHGAVECRVCGNLHWAENCYHDESNDTWVCDSCYETGNYMVCEDCGRIMVGHSMHHVEDEDKYVCVHCMSNYYICDHCGDLFTDDSMHFDNYSGQLCDSCRDDYYICADCGCFVHYENAIELDDGDYYCESCADSNRGALHQYGYKPDPIFYDTNEDALDDEPTLYMGVELETDDGCRGDVEEHDYVYYKEDGSLSSSGVEIVSHPASLKFHLNDFGWSEICSDFRSWGYLSHKASNSCGLHVHVNRDFFGVTAAEQDLHIAKVVLLVNRFYDSHLERFARRSSAQWARKPDVRVTNADVTDNEIVHTIHDKVKDSGRYVAVNLQNRNTIEFRLFRGTLKVTTLYATLQFVDTLCRFAKKMELREVDLVQWEHIFAGLDREEYHYLFDYMENRGLNAELTAPEKQFVKRVPFSVDDPEDTAYYVDFNECYDIAIHDNLYQIGSDRAYTGTRVEYMACPCFKIRTGSCWGDTIIPQSALYRYVD